MDPPLLTVHDAVEDSCDVLNHPRFFVVEVEPVGCCPHSMEVNSA